MSNKPTFDYQRLSYPIHVLKLENNDTLFYPKTHGDRINIDFEDGTSTTLNDFIKSYLNNVNSITNNSNYLTIIDSIYSTYQEDTVKDDAKSSLESIDKINKLYISHPLDDGTWSNVQKIVNEGYGPEVFPIDHVFNHDRTGNHNWYVVGYCNNYKCMILMCASCRRGHPYDTNGDGSGIDIKNFFPNSNLYKITFKEEFDKLNPEFKAVINTIDIWENSCIINTNTHGITLPSISDLTNITSDYDFVEFENSSSDMQTRMPEISVGIDVPVSSLNGTFYNTNYYMQHSGVKADGRLFESSLLFLRDCDYEIATRSRYGKDKLWVYNPAKDIAYVRPITDCDGAARAIEITDGIDLPIGYRAFPVVCIGRRN